MATTAFCYSAKVEMPSGAHCFLATQSGLACTGVSTQFTLTGLASTAALVVGMAVTGTNVAAGAVVASVDSTTQVTLSKAHTGSVAAATFTGDVFKLALIKVSPSRTFAGDSTNAGTPGSGTPSATNLGTDEVTGTGYAAGGFALTNTSPAIASTTYATWSFGTNPSWTSATISATAAMIYNTSTRFGGVANRAISIHDFGGTQSVTAGTLTVTLPTNAANTAILQIS